jgi:hypothetical protein
MNRTLFDECSRVTSRTTWYLEIAKIERDRDRFLQYSTWSGATGSAVARMRVVATIEDPAVIRKILTHLGLPADVPAPRPPPSALFAWS